MAVTPRQVQQIVRDVIRAVDPETGRVDDEVKQEYLEYLKKDSKSLKMTYRIIATDEGVQFVGDDGEVHTGTGGGWPKAHFR